jgi:hypothetical protein
LAAAGHDVKVSKVKRQRQRYETGGLARLVDHRVIRQPSQFGRPDSRVVEAMRAAIGEATNASTRTAGFVLWRTEQLLAGRPDAAEIVMPSRAALYRLLGKSCPWRWTGRTRTS